VALVQHDRDAAHIETFVALKSGRMSDVIQDAIDGNLRIALSPTDVDCATLCDRAAQIERWTILSGSDDPAIVACYQLLKLLVTEGEPVGPTRGVGLVLVGCDEAAARVAAERIRTTAERHLGVDVELARVIRRIEPTPGRHTRSFPGNDPWPQIVRLLDAPDTDPQEPLVTEAEIEALREGQPLDEPRTTAAAPSAARSPVRLAAWLTDVQPLQARCPRQPRAELAVDGEGRLHVAMRVADGQTADSVIVQLLEARLWAAEHRDVLALTSPQTPLSRGAEPVAHLFTDQPAAAASLACAGPTGDRTFRLHLLKAVHINGSVHHLHEPL
jgi:hypothetical protein